MRFFVKQTYDDKGHVRCTLYTAEQAHERGLHHGYFAETDTCDIYVDGFTTEREALRFIARARRA